MFILYFISDTYETARSKLELATVTSDLETSTKKASVTPAMTPPAAPGTSGIARRRLNLPADPTKTVPTFSVTEVETASGSFVDFDSLDNVQNPCCSKHEGKFLCVRINNFNNFNILNCN